MKFFVLFCARYSLFQIAQSITPNIIMFLPRNVDLDQLEELAWLSSPPLTLEVLSLNAALCQEEEEEETIRELI